jgi:Tol biopolymer transport system component
VTINEGTVDGRFLLYQINRHGQVDLALLPLTNDRTPRPLLDSAASEQQGQFSPDGKWLAHTSDESGSHEVYVRRFPGTGTK